MTTDSWDRKTLKRKGEAKASPFPFPYREPGQINMNDQSRMYEV